jgi:hypothetical protein
VNWTNPTLRSFRPTPGQEAGSDSDETDIYWTDVSKKEIHRANFDGSGDETVVAPPAAALGSIAGIALDLVQGKMYSTDATEDKIQRANLDGSNGEDVVTSADGLPCPRGVFVTRGEHPAIVPSLQTPAVVGLLALLLAAGAAALKLRGSAQR